MSLGIIATQSTEHRGRMECGGSVNRVGIQVWGDFTLESGVEVGDMVELVGAEVGVEVNAGEGLKVEVRLGDKAGGGGDIVGGSGPRSTGDG